MRNVNAKVSGARKLLIRAYGAYLRLDDLKNETDAKCTNGK